MIAHGKQLWIGLVSTILAIVSPVSGQVSVSMDTLVTGTVTGPTGELLPGALYTCFVDHVTAAFEMRRTELPPGTTDRDGRFHCVTALSLHPTVTRILIWLRPGRPFQSTIASVCTWHDGGCSGTPVIMANRAPPAGPGWLNLRGSVGLWVGVTGGLLGTVTANTVDQSFDPRLGYHIGIFGQLRTARLALRLGAAYVNAGALFLGAPYLPNDAFDVSVFAIPLDLRVRLGLLDVFAGPELQWSVSPGAGEDFADDLAAWVLHGGIGAGLRLGHFFSEIRYILGVTGITEERFVVGTVPVVLAGPHRSHMLRLSVGLAWWD